MTKNGHNAHVVRLHENTTILYRESTCFILQKNIYTLRFFFLNMCDFKYNLYTNTYVQIILISLHLHVQPLHLQALQVQPLQVGASSSVLQVQLQLHLHLQPLQVYILL